MPKKNVKNASRYATVSVVKPKAPTPPPSPPKEEKVEVIVDPYTYHVSDVFYLDIALPPNQEIRALGEFCPGSTTSSYATCEVECLGEEEVPTYSFTAANRSFGKVTKDTFHASDLSLMSDRYSPIKQGWVISSGETNVERTEAGVKKMFSYRITYKYIPENIRYKKTYLLLNIGYTPLIVSTVNY